jgi:hypothetical protein
MVKGLKKITPVTPLPMVTAKKGDHGEEVVAEVKVRLAIDPNDIIHQSQDLDQRQCVATIRPNTNAQVEDRAVVEVMIDINKKERVVIVGVDLTQHRHLHQHPVHLLQLQLQLLLHRPDQVEILSRTRTDKDDATQDQNHFQIILPLQVIIVVVATTAAVIIKIQR